MPTYLDQQELFSAAISPVMRKVGDQIRLLADLNVPVLIIGEAGTGKEATARLLHGCSQRRERPFRKLSCAGTTPNDIERKLFGFTERWFSSEICEQPGALDFCHEGVLFLEDIGELPSALQSNLLHVMEQKQYFRPGTGNEVKADVRIIAGAKVDLGASLAGNKVREDFYFHLSTFKIHLPPLRERREDIPSLLEYFMLQWAGTYSRPAVRFTQEVIDACMSYSWPGNIVELENFVRRYLVIGDEALALSDLRHDAREEQNSSQQDNGTTRWFYREHEQSLKNLVRQLKGEAEIEEITKALRETRWNRHAAARRLKISYRGLLYKIQHYHLHPPGPLRSQ